MSVAKVDCFKTGVIHDAFGQTYGKDHYFHMKIVVFCEIWNMGTDDMCENSDHYWPWLWIGLVDQ